MNRIQVFSYGGGVQSVAIAALIMEGRLPRPDMAIISDTGYERGSTWDYMAQYTAPALESAGVTITRIKATDWGSQGAIVQGTTVMLPVHIHNGKSRGFCSNEWKKYPIRRYLRASGVVQCDMWIGFTSEEMRRVRVSDVAWAQNKYPLLGGLFGGPGDLVMNRQECLAIIHRHGWPIPEKSSCYICPNMRNSEWRSISRSEFNQAVDVDIQVRHISDGYEKFLHKSCKPLADIDFSINDNTADLFGCDSGLCFI